MSRLDALPPDQRAALSLLLRQRRSYGEIAVLLAIPERAVHDRAHAALALLAPRQARGLSADLREQVGDYLLGQQQSVADRLATRTQLERSPNARLWAGAVASELQPLAAAPLPEIPAAGTDGAAAPPDGAPATPAPAGRPPGGEVPIAVRLPSSRLGGMILLGILAVAVIVTLVLVLGGGGSSSTNSTPRTTRASGPKVTARLQLTPPEPGSSAIGAIDVIAEGKNRAFLIIAEHLPPTKGFYYALWLTNPTGSPLPLSKASSVGSNGRLQGSALLPSNAASYHTILLTRETSARPTHPGPVLLSGTFSVGH